MQPRLSILIPCYNVERYIRRCLESIYRINLSYNEYEVLCFDDCSTDSTPSILDEYAERFKNFWVLHSRANIGPGGGRNRLFVEAHGRYLWYVDGDDMIISEQVPSMLHIVERIQADVLVFNYREWNEDESEIPVLYSLPEGEEGTGLELADKVFDGGLVNNMGYPVRFLIKRSYYEKLGLSFPERMTYGEDTIWMAKLVLMAEKMCTTSLYGYIYWHHDSSTCGTLKRIYPGRTIYEKCVVTSLQLFGFVKELKNAYNKKQDGQIITYANKIYDYTIKHYVNNLPIMLCRTTNKERNVFYKYLRNGENIKDIRHRANLLTNICMIPFVGLLMSSCLSVAYKLSHPNK